MRVALLLAVLLHARGPDTASSLEQLSTGIAAQVARAHLEAPVGVYVEGPPSALARAFASSLATQLAAKKLGPVVVEARDAAEAERLGRERGVRSLVRLSVVLSAQKLVVRGDGISTWVNFWSGAVPTRSGPSAALTATVEADPEALLLAGPASPVTGPLELRQVPFARLSGVPAALAVADLDGDQRAEVLALVNEELLIFSSDGRQVASADLKSSAWAVTPAREPFGAIGVLGGPTRIAVWSARRARGEVFTYSGGVLKPAGPVDAVPVESVVLKLEPGFNHFEPEVVWSGRTLTLGAFQAISTRGSVALVLGNDGGAVIRGGVSVATRFRAVGTGATLADLDGDGAPELVASGPKRSGDGDELRVLSLEAVEALQAEGGRLPEARPLWQGTLARGRVVVAAAGDLEGTGREEAILGTWQVDGTGELVLLRRSP